MRLLEDLLEHEVLVARAFGHHGIPRHPLRRSDACPAVKVGESNTLPRQDCDLTVVEEHHVARMGQDGGDVGGDEKLAVTQPHHDWRAVAGGDDDLGVVGRDQHDGKKAAQLPQRAADGGLEPVAPHLALDQVRDDLGIGFGDEPVAVGLERRLEVEIVLDDAVVHDHQAARAIPVGMSVFLGGAAVGGPPRVAQAVRPPRSGRRPGLPRAGRACPRFAARRDVRRRPARPQPSHSPGIRAAGVPRPEPAARDAGRCTR